MVSVTYLTEPRQHYSAIREILSLVDDEFVPPLTDASRGEVTKLDAAQGGYDIEGYVERCLKRPLIGAVSEETVVGLLSFQHIEYASTIDPYTPSNHVEILAVRPSFRGNGVATAMYRFLLEKLPPAVAQPHVSTKTWDSNTAHIGILERLGFELVHRLPDDRAPGVATVFYARSI